MTVDVETLRLRPIASSDAARIHQWTSVPKASVFQTWGPNTEAETEAFVDSAVQAWTASPQRRWVWAVEEPTGLVDGIGEVKRHSPTQMEISYAVHVDYWGQGIGAAIGRLLTRWAFQSWPDVERVEATCDPRNVGSEHVPGPRKGRSSAGQQAQEGSFWIAGVAS